MPSATELSTIEHLILLDLLGAKNPTIQNYFLDTAWLFDAMASSERRLAKAGVFAGVSKTDDNWRSFFTPRNEYTQNYGFIEDDHIPFMKLGVSILHIIASTVYCMEQCHISLLNNLRRSTTKTERS